VSVDLPEVIDLRERFIAPTPRHLHLRGDAADLGWLDVLEPGACVIAQGLFMYLDPDAVRRILTSWWARSGPGDGARSALLFDVVPPWVSRLSRLRVPLTPRFRLPPMPWGARREALEPMLAEVLGEGAHVAFHPCPLPAGPIRVAGTTVVVEIRT
jgi:O-methyltransferase involved in polyketide biosynthesis